MRFEKKAYLKGFIKEAITREEYIRLVRNRQAVPAPSRLRLGRTGVDTRRGYAGIEQYYGPVNPYRNPTIASPGMVARRGQVNWEDLPSTRMMMAANGDTPSRSIVAKSTQSRESAAYDAILAKLNAKPNADVKLNQERAKRLAPLVAKNYKLINGKWTSVVNNKRLAKVKSNAKAIWSETKPKQQIAQQSAPAPAAPTAPAASTAPAAPKMQFAKVDPSLVPAATSAAAAPAATSQTQPAKDTGTPRYMMPADIGKGLTKKSAVLFKSAQAPALKITGILGNILGKARGGLSRWWELFRGGNNKLRAFKGELSKLRDAFNSSDVIKNYQNLNGKDWVKKWTKDIYDSTGRYIDKAYTPDLAKENLKVWGTRLGTGTLGVYGANKLIGRMFRKNEENQNRTIGVKK